MPNILRGAALIAASISAYWIIPARCYLYVEHKKPTLWVQRATHMFEEFKLGEDG
jgi:hypothetical protein